MNTLTDILEALAKHCHSVDGQKNIPIKVVLPKHVIKEFSKGFEAFDRNGKPLNVPYEVSAYHTNDGTVQLFPDDETNVIRKV